MKQLITTMGPMKKGIISLISFVESKFEAYDIVYDEDEEEFLAVEFV